MHKICLSIKVWKAFSIIQRIKVQYLNLNWVNEREDCIKLTCFVAYLALKIAGNKSLS
jgi:hypothetical protein